MKEKLVHLRACPSKVTFFDPSFLPENLRHVYMQVASYFYNQEATLLTYSIVKNGKFLMYYSLNKEEFYGGYLLSSKTLPYLIEPIKFKIDDFNYVNLYRCSMI